MFVSELVDGQLVGRDISCGDQWYHQEIYQTHLPKECLRIYATNITDVKRLQQRESESGNFLRSIMSSTSDLVFIKDTQLRTVFCNDVFAKLVGKKSHELYGKTDVENGWSTSQVKGDANSAIQGWENNDLEVLAGKTVRALREPVDSFDGVRYFDTVKVPLRDENHVIIGLLGIGRDDTEQVRIEIELKRSEERYR